MDRAVVLANRISIAEIYKRREVSKVPGEEPVKPLAGLALSLMRKHWRARKSVGSRLAGG
jgi:hypothetical protein